MTEEEEEAKTTAVTPFSSRLLLFIGNSRPLCEQLELWEERTQCSRVWILNNSTS